TLYTGADLHALHDFFEVAIGPDEGLHIGYMHAEDSTDAPVHDYGARTLWYVHGEPAGREAAERGAAGNTSLLRALPRIAP
ncbi:MAG: hypothetical protein LC624_12345, partial [Halobacteriales archaeon]|nr:hypothetical protein [Halobacteriales archaeon]